MSGSQSPATLGALLRQVEQVLAEREVQYARGERGAAQGNQVAAFTAVHELMGPIRKVFAEYTPPSEIAAPAITEAEAAQYLDEGFSIKVLNPERGNYWRCPHCQMTEMDGHEQSCVIRVLVERLLGRNVPFGQLPAKEEGIPW